MYLIKLLEDQVAQYWEVIKYAIRQSLPPITYDSDEKLNNLLEALLLGKLQCWVVSANPEDVKTEALITTRISEDEVSRTRSLLIYTLFSFKPLSEEVVNALRDGLLRYAKANKCSRVIAYTKDANVLSIATKYGMTSSYTFLSFDID